MIVFAISLALALLLLPAVAQSNEPATGDILERADSLFNAERYDKAIGLCEQVIESSPNNSDPQDTLLIRAWLLKGNCALQSGRHMKAEQAGRRVYELVKSPARPDSVHLERALVLLVESLVSQRKVLAAKPYAHDLVALRRVMSGVDPELLVKALFLLARLQFWSTEYHAAIGSSTEALATAQKVCGRTHIVTADCSNILGLAYKNLGSYSTSEPYLVEAIDVLDSLGNDRAHSYRLNLASLYMVLNRLDEAEITLNAVTRFAAQTGNQNHPALLYRTAALDLSKGDAQGAVDKLTQAIVSLNSGNIPDDLLKARCFSRLARAHESREDFERSLPLYDSAIAIFAVHQTTERLSLAHVYTGKGSLLSRLGRFEEAERLLRSALEIREDHSGRESIVTAYSLLELGDHLARVGDFEKAADLLNEALDLHKKELGTFHPAVSGCYRRLAVLQAASGADGASLASYRIQLDIRHRTQRAAFASSSDVQKLRWIEKYPVVDHSLISNAAANGSALWAEAAFDMTLNGKSVVVDALAMEREQAFCGSDPRTIRLWEERLGVCTHIADICYASSRIGDRAVDSLSVLYGVLDSIERQLSASCAKVASRFKGDPVATQEVKSALDRGEVLWEFLRHQSLDYRAPLREFQVERYVAFVLSGVGDVHLVDLGDADLIDSLVVDVRTKIAASGTGVFSPAGEYIESDLQSTLHRLHEVVAAPLLRESGGCSRVIVAPDGDLNNLPFETLVDDGGRYFVEDYHVTYLGCGRDLVRGNRRGDRAGLTVAIVADPDFDAAADREQSVLAEADSRQLPGMYRTARMTSVSAPQCVSEPFHRIPYTREEAVRVAAAIELNTSLVPVSYLGKDASEGAVKRFDEPPRILHIATHGFVCDQSANGRGDVSMNPLVYSGLVLAGANSRNDSTGGSSAYGNDGILTALEVSGLNLTGTELVVLSACESGAGEVVDGEGVYGLRRSFTHAGAESILMTLWSVPDQRAAELIGRFYREWLSGATKQDALRQATLAMLRESRETLGHGHPLMWSGFVLSGNPK